MYCKLSYIFNSVFLSFNKKRIFNNIVYNNITEKFVIYFKNYEFINDLNDDDKYYLQYNLKYNLNTYITKYYKLQNSL